LEGLVQHQRLNHQIRLQQIGLNGLGWLPIYCVVVNKVHGVGNFIAKPTMDLVLYWFIYCSFAWFGTRSERVELSMARCVSNLLCGGKQGPWCWQLYCQTHHGPCPLLVCHLARLCLYCSFVVGNKIDVVTLVANNRSFPSTGGQMLNILYKQAFPLVRL
jgi:hypothetical protein